MKVHNILASCAVFVAAASLVQAADTSWLNRHTSSGPDTELFTARELSLDLFGSYIAPERKFTDLFDTNIRHRGAWGGGAGLNYFLTREIGIGADVNMSDHPGRIVDEVVGSVIARLPLGNSGLAPYIIGSGGRGIYPEWEWVYGGGVGVEYRFSRTLGVFTDGRFLWSDRTTADNRLLLRAGLRFVF